MLSLDAWNPSLQGVLKGVRRVTAVTPSFYTWFKAPYGELN